jgi:hypothetical protein
LHGNGEIDMAMKHRLLGTYDVVDIWSDSNDPPEGPVENFQMHHNLLKDRLSFEFTVGGKGYIVTLRISEMQEEARRELEEKIDASNAIRQVQGDEAI